MIFEKSGSYWFYPVLQKKLIFHKYLPLSSTSIKSSLMLGSCTLWWINSFRLPLFWFKYKSLIRKSSTFKDFWSTISNNILSSFWNVDSFFFCAGDFLRVQFFFILNHLLWHRRILFTTLSLPEVGISFFLHSSITWSATFLALYFTEYLRILSWWKNTHITSFTVGNFSSRIFDIGMPIKGISLFILDD